MPERCRWNCCVARQALAGDCCASRPAPQIAEKVDDHPKVASHLRRHFDPKTETGVALTIATVAVGAAAVGIGLVVAMIRSKTGLERYDIRLAQFGADHATQWSTNVMRDISRLGGTPVVVLLALIATTIEMIRRPSRWLPVFMVLVIGGQFACCRTGSSTSWSGPVQTSAGSPDSPVLRFRRVTRRQQRRRSLRSL